MKSIQVSPCFINLKNSHYNQTSRFIRKYFHDDNFMKVEFIDEKYDKLFTNISYTHYFNFIIDCLNYYRVLENTSIV